MEQGSAADIFYRASHPYTVGLLGAVPRLDQDDAELVAIPGAPPNMARLPRGCPFSERCPLADAYCTDVMPLLQPAAPGATALRACHRSVPQVAAMRVVEVTHV